MESSTDTYTHAHSVAVRRLPCCSFIEGLPIGASAWNALALFLMILSLLGKALLALKLAASMPKLGPHTRSNLRKTCSNLGLEICKHLQNLIQPSLDEEVAELAKRTLLKTMDGLFSVLVIVMINSMILLTLRDGIPILILGPGAETTVVFDLVVRYCFDMLFMVPPMAFLQFPRTRTDRNINIWMAVMYIQHTFFLITPVWAADQQARVPILNLMHVLFAFCSWRTSCVFWLNLAWAFVAACSVERSKM